MTKHFFWAALLLGFVVGCGADTGTTVPENVDTMSDAELEEYDDQMMAEEQSDE